MIGTHSVVLAGALIACTSPARQRSSAGREPPPPLAATVVQLEYRLSYTISAQYTPIPPFTLLDDGTLIDGHTGPTVTATKLPPDEVQRIRAHVLELGFERLESRRSCRDDQVCGSDLPYTVIRVALPSGELREVTTYDGASNEPKIEKQIAEYLVQYEHPAGSPYRPTRAAVHLSVESSPAPSGCVSVDLDLVRARDGAKKSWAFMVEDAALASLLAVAPSNVGFFAACAGGKHYGLTIIPELPNVDLATDLAIYLR